MGKTVKVILIALALILLLLLLLVLFVPESQWARNWVEDQASQRLEGREVEIADIAVDWGWPPLVRIEGVRIANPDWAEHEYMLELEALELVPEMGALLSGDMGLQRLDIEQPRVHLARRADGTNNWGELISEDDDEPPVVPDVLTIDDGQLTYQDEMLNASLEASVRTTTEDESDRRLAITGEGSWEGKPLQFDAWGAAPLQVLDEDASYPLMLEGSLGELQVQFDGQARDPLQPDVMQGTFAISAPQEAQLAAWLGYPELSVPAFELRGRLQRDGSSWMLKNLELESADINLDGSVTLVRGDPPRFDIELHSTSIDLNRWNVVDYLSGEQQEQASEAQDIPLAESLAKRFALLRGRDMQLDLSAEQLTYGNEALQDVELQAMLDGDRIEVQRLSAGQGDGQFQANGSLDIKSNEAEGEADISLDQFHLGQALQPFRASDLGVLDGVIHARFVDGVMTLRDTELAYDAPAQNISVEVEAESRALSDAQVPGLHVQGTGVRYGESFRFDLDLGPLLDLTAAQKPYPIKGTLASGESNLYLDGTIVRPLEMESIDTQFRLEGPNPSRINTVTQLSLPSLPPYHIEGRLRWHDGLLRLNNFTGGFGESDLAGDVRLRTGERPMLWATLRSSDMDYDDLRPLWGSPPGTGEGEVATQRQERLAREQEQEGRFFSDQPWNPEALRRMDARVDFEADKLNAKGLPLEDLDVEMEMQDGKLTLRPLNFGIGGGEVDSEVRINARQARVTGHLESSVTTVNLKSLLSDAFPDVARDSAGIIGGEADISFAGISTADFMAGADGQLELAMSGGQLDMLAVELLGLDAGEALIAALAETDQVPIRCAYVRLQAEEGQVDLEQLFMDTDDANFTGAGTIDLRTEQIDMALESHPKDLSIFTANSPVQLRGTLDSPQVEVTSTELLARGIASAIGLAVAPPLAILPWVDPGLGEGVGPGCRQVLDELRSEQ